MKRIPRIIPPRSRVRLIRADRTSREWQREIGRQFRVGSYSRQDGLDCIWLVNEKGEYEQTTDRDGFLRYFAIEKLTDERDYYGVHSGFLLTAFSNVRPNPLFHSILLTKGAPPKKHF
jgi:hypothetical protein